MTDKNAKIVISTLIFSCMLVLLLGLIGSACTVGLIEAGLGKEFSLHIGQTAQIENEPLAIRFNGIKSDSRCPIGVTCVWAGEVNCDVTVTYQGVSSNIILNQLGTDLSSETYKGYNLIYSIEPYPQAGRQISLSEYTLILTVEKQNPP
jgi:hypothetical protein